MNVKFSRAIKRFSYLEITDVSRTISVLIIRVLKNCNNLSPDTADSLR
jgi:hypothetical protein